MKKLHIYNYMYINKNNPERLFVICIKTTSLWNLMLKKVFRYLNKKILRQIIGNWHTLLIADNIHGKWNLLYKQGSKHYGIYQKKSQASKHKQTLYTTHLYFKWFQFLPFPNQIICILIYKFLHLQCYMYEIMFLHVFVNF